MTAPQTPSSDGMLAQILLKQGEMGTQLAVISEQLKAVPDHEARLRAVEAQLPPHLEDRVGSLETTKAKMVGVACAVSVVASAGGTWLGLIIAHH